MAINYRYFGVLGSRDTPEDPGGVIRTWIDEDGRELEETFGPSLTWEPSMWLAPGTPSDGYKYVEIDDSVAERVVERVTTNITAGRYRSRS